MRSLIGTTLVGRTLRNLLSPPATRRRPRPPLAGSRGHLAIDLAACTFCGVCARQCAPLALTVDREARTLRLEPLRCIACGVRTEVCKPRCLTMAPEPVGAFDAGVERFVTLRKP